jgi:uncharacterized protein YneF (UPF0154 family)
MKPKTKTILFILLSFILGVLCGWFLQDRVFLMADRIPPDFQKMLTERLHLDEGQVAQLDSILEARRKHMEVQWNQMLAVRDTVRMEIRKILNADQLKIFDEILQQKDAREAKIRPHGSPKK